MKLRVGFILGLLVLNGTLYAMISSAPPLPSMPIPLENSAVRQSNLVVKKIEEKSEQENLVKPVPKSSSRLQSLSAEYKIYRAINSSS